jgi:serpin B
MRTVRFVVVVSIACLVLTACEQDERPRVERIATQPVAPAPAADVPAAEAPTVVVPARKVTPEEATAGNNEFAFDLYKRLSDGDDNIFFSPFSVWTALAMTYGGARGETERQMRTALHYPAGQLHDAIAAAVAGVLRRSSEAGIDLGIANSVWAAKWLTLRDAYVALLRDSYGLTPGSLDFADAEAARRVVNGWVDDKTRGKVKDIVPPGEFDATTAVVLANAIYFKAAWLRSFGERSTRETAFRPSPDKTVRVRMMSQTAKFEYAADGECQILSMPYRGGDLSMVVLLPRRHDGLADLEKTLSAERVDAKVRQLKATKVSVFFPRFKLTIPVKLNSALKALGMTDAFGNAANFSGMADGRAGEALFIESVLHKAFVEVNEEGTEAAAATVVHMAKKNGGGGHKPTPVFRADHPFVFMIRDGRTGSILFLGRVIKP